MHHLLGRTCAYTSLWIFHLRTYRAHIESRESVIVFTFSPRRDCAYSRQYERLYESD
jgi:hypothetical protein